jgi:Spy/CpxP family protein refolding chaperone
VKEAVMKILMTVVALGVGTGAWAALVAAQEKADQKPGGALAGRIQALHLTDEQETKIADIRKEYRPKVHEAAKDLATVVKEEEEKVLGILTPEQKTKVQADRAELKEMRAESLGEEIAHLGDLQITDAEINQIADIRKEYRPKMEAALNELEGLLTDDQKKARQEALHSGKKGQETLESLKLSDEIKEKVHAACKKARSLFQEEVEKIRDALSSEQKERLQELKEETKEHVRDRMVHRIANLQDLHLTEEQKTQIADIRKEFRPKVHEAGNKLRSIIKEEVEAIVNVIKS